MRRGSQWVKNGGGPLSHGVGASVVPEQRRPPRPCGGGLGGPKTEDAPSPMRWGTRWPSPMGRALWWSPSGRDPLAHAAQASVVPKRRRPPRPFGGGLGGQKKVQAPLPMRRGPWWSQNGGGPRAHVAGASVGPKRRTPRLPCGGVLGGPEADEAPSPMRRRPRWSQSGGSPLAHAAWASVVAKGGGPLVHAVGSLVVPKRRTPRAHAAGASVVPKRRMSRLPCGAGLGGPKAEAPSSMRRGPRWSQNGGGPLAHAVGSSVVPKQRTPRAHAARDAVVPKRGMFHLPCGAGLGGPEAEEAPSPMRRGPRWTQSGRGPLARGDELWPM